MQQGTAREQRGGWGGRGQKKRNKSKEKQTRNEREIKTIAAAAAASYRARAVAVYSSGLWASPLAPVVVDVDVFTAQLLKQPHRGSFSIFGAPASSRLCSVERKMISFLSFFFLLLLYIYALTSSYQTAITGAVLCQQTLAIDSVGLVFSNFNRPAADIIFFRFSRLSLCDVALMCVVGR
jgi:hypothetical protein